MIKTQIVVLDPVGLHARPAALFVRVANKFASNISICNLSTTSKWANAKSILGLLTCGVKQGDQIEIKADGSDENIAVETLEKLVRSNFTEDADGDR